MYTNNRIRHYRNGFWDNLIRSVPLMRSPGNCRKDCATRTLLGHTQCDCATTVPLSLAEKSFIRVPMCTTITQAHANY